MANTTRNMRDSLSPRLRKNRRWRILTGILKQATETNDCLFAHRIDPVHCNLSQVFTFVIAKVWPITRNRQSIAFRFHGSSKAILKMTGFSLLKSLPFSCCPRQVQHNTDEENPSSCKWKISSTTHFNQLRVAVNVPSEPPIGAKRR
jgi:hypothetical protein